MASIRCLKWSACHCHENHDLLTVNHAAALLTFIFCFFATNTDCLTTFCCHSHIFPSYSYFYCNKTAITWYYFKSLLEHVGSLCSHCITVPRAAFFKSRKYTSNLLEREKTESAISITHVSSTIQNLTAMLKSGYTLFQVCPANAYVDKKKASNAFANKPIIFFSIERQDFIFYRHHIECYNFSYCVDFGFSGFLKCLAVFMQISYKTFVWYCGTCDFLFQRY